MLIYEAFLLSSLGLGSLDKILNNLNRFDILNFGDGSIIKKLHAHPKEVLNLKIIFKTIAKYKFD